MTMASALCSHAFREPSGYAYYGSDAASAASSHWLASVASSHTHVTSEELDVDMLDEALGFLPPCAPQPQQWPATAGGTLEPEPEQFPAAMDTAADQGHDDDSKQHLLIREHDQQILMRHLQLERQPWQQLQQQQQQQQEEEDAMLFQQCQQQQWDLDSPVFDEAGSPFGDLAPPTSHPRKVKFVIGSTNSSASSAAPKNAKSVSFGTCTERSASFAAADRGSIIVHDLPAQMKRNDGPEQNSFHVDLMVRTYFEVQPATVQDLQLALGHDNCKAIASSAPAIAGRLDALSARLEEISECDAHIGMLPSNSRLGAVHLPGVQQLAAWLWACC